MTVAPTLIQTPSTVAVTPATPRILPAMISRAEAEAMSTSRTRLDFSSITLLSRMPAPETIMVHRRKPRPKPTTPGRRSRSPTLPAALGEYAVTLGALFSIAEIWACGTPAVIMRSIRIRRSTAPRTMPSSVRSATLRLQTSTATPSASGWITAAASSRSGPLDISLGLRARAARPGLPGSGVGAATSVAAGLDASLPRPSRGVLIASATAPA